MKNPRAFLFALVVAFVATFAQCRYVHQREQDLLYETEPTKTLVTTRDILDNVRIDETMVELARKRRHRRAVSLSLGDVCDIQQPGANHDTVVDFGIIHHVPQWQQDSAVITRVLSPGG